MTLAASLGAQAAPESHASQRRRSRRRWSSRRRRYRSVIHQAVENCALAMRAAIASGALEITVGTLNKSSLGIGAIGRVEAGQDGEGLRRRANRREQTEDASEAQDYP